MAQTLIISRQSTIKPMPLFSVLVFCHVMRSRPGTTTNQPAATANRGDDLRRGGNKRSLRTPRSQVNCLVLAHIGRQIKVIDEVIAAILRDRVAQNMELTSNRHEVW